jgi:hypothetical protein
MTRQNVPGAMSIRDPLPVALGLIRALATSVLDEHTDEVGLCGVCGSAWPRCARRGRYPQPGHDLT